MQGIRLDQHAFQLQVAQQLFEGTPLTRFMGVVVLLGQGDDERPGIDRHLGDKPVIPLFCLDPRATQCLADTYQLVQTLGPA